MEGNVFSLLEKNLRSLVGKRFREPTPVQKAVIPKILKGENVLVLSETGSGKTEAILLPVFNQLVKSDYRPVCILYITPLRSLNRDLLKRVLWWANRLDFEVGVRHGDTSQYERSMQAENPPAMLISTPETLQAILTGKVMREHLKNIRYCVIDEIHELVDNKRGVQLSVALARLRELITSDGCPEPQIVGLSATIGSPELIAKFLTDKPCKIVNAVKTKELGIEVVCPEPEKRDSQIGAQLFISPELTARLRFINNLIKTKRSVLVFTNTRESAEILSSRLKVFDPELNLETHHSSLSKEVRIQAEGDFKNEKLRAMVCTSSLELGIDIGSIDFVLQYMSPRQTTKLLQRVGRSGHTLEQVSAGTIIAQDANDCFESAVIAKNALEGQVEPSKVYSKALDVLGHQIVGLSLEEYNIPAEKAYRVIKNARPFSGVTREEFLEMCQFMQKLGYIWMDTKFSDKPVLRRRKKAWEYYYRNLSTIPDVKNYQIFDVVKNVPVGSLDAGFVAMHGTPGTSFICKGRAWKILEVQGDRIMVEPTQGIEGAIPAWEGELIPVPYRIAQGVGKLRREVASRLDKGAERFLLDNYPITEDVARRLVKSIKEQSEWGFVPTDRDILIEWGVQKERAGKFMERELSYIIIHTCFGSLVNETIGRALSILLMNRMGSVGLQTDPYRIVLKFSRHPEQEAESIADMLKELNGALLKTLLKLSIPNTELFRWRFLHIAKRFGIISRDAECFPHSTGRKNEGKGHTFGKGYLQKIISAYRGSPAYKEALHEIWQEKLDLETSAKVLENIKKNNIKITIRPGLSPLGKSALMSRYEIVASERPEHEIFSAFKNRLLSTKVRLICCQCGWAITYPVKDVPEIPRCFACGAKLLGVIKPYETEKESLLKRFINRATLTDGDMKTVNSVMDSASLVVGSGRDAVLVLAGRGIGPRTAARILSRMSQGDELLKDILEAEREYARTKRFWH